MKAPSEQTIKRLFGLSRNRCAFPDCSTAIIQTSGTVTGRICHIKARRPNGPRYDSAQTDEERHAFENLILLCSVHHDIVDSEPDNFTVERLKQLKDNQEKNGREETAQTSFPIHRLIDSYLRIEAHEEALVMVDSPMAIQARTIHAVNFHEQSPPQSFPRVSLQFEFVVESWVEERFGGNFPPVEPKISEGDYLKIYAENHGGGLATHLQGRARIPAALLIETIVRRKMSFADIPQALAGGELETIEVSNKLRDAPIHQFMKPPPPDWKPISPGMRICLRSLMLVPFREQLKTFPGAIRWEISANGSDQFTGEAKLSEIPFVDARRYKSNG